MYEMNISMLKNFTQIIISNNNKINNKNNTHAIKKIKKVFHKIRQYN